VNVIVGESDVGKSSIVRAFTWLFTNRPVGNAFLTHGAKSTKVVLETDDHTITKTKGKGQNKYEIDGEVLKAIKQDVPEEIVNALSIKPEVSLMRQMDSPFLLSASSGEVARHLNKVASLQIIDNVLSRINSDRLQTTTAHQNAVEEVEQYKEELLRYGFLRDLEQQIGVAEATLQDAEDLQAGCNGLEGYISSIKGAETRKRQTISRKKLEQARAVIEEIEAGVKERGQLVRQTQGLYKLIEDIEDNVGKGQAALKSQEVLNAKYKKLMPRECPLCGRS